jgi:hypothetical protein
MQADRYRRLIESLVADPPPFTATCETASAVQVERGAALADALAGRPVAHLPAVRPEVVDAAGHRRPVYRPLLVHAATLAGAAGVEPWAASLSFDVDVPFTAAGGVAAAAAVWAALAMQVAGVDGPGHDRGLRPVLAAREEQVPASSDAPRTGRRPVSRRWLAARPVDDAVAQLFQRLVACQQPNGALLRTTSSDNPETHWFHELVILHAAADYALWTGDPAVRAAVGRATLFHLNETEPDHATGQPWGLPAFIRVAGAGPLADALLHAVSAHQPAGPTGVALLLLADTLYGLRHAPLGFVPAVSEENP